MSDRAELFNEAVRIWFDLTGVDADTQKFNMSNWDIRSMNESLEQAMALDPSLVTAYLIFARNADSFLTGQQFSAKDMLENPQNVMDFLAKSKSLLDILNNEEIAQIGDEFAAQMRAACETYGFSNPEVSKLIDNRLDLGYLRRDALLSLEKNLRINQFMMGESENEAVRPVYHPFVFQYWNVNSLLTNMVNLPSGVTVNLIRDPDEFQSYFVFAIRNGGNIILFTDVPDAEHPLQRYMSRRPDRDFSRRSARNWFPYEVLDIKLSEDGERLYVDKSQNTGMVPYQETAVRLKPIAECGPGEVVWITMMFDLIVERFWKQGYRAPELSYTAEMVKVQSPLLEAAKQANLPVAAHQVLEMKPVTNADVRSDAVDPKQVGKTGTFPNQWMETRYGDRVPDSLLNLAATPTVTYLLDAPSSRDDSFVAKATKNALVLADGVKSMATSDLNNLPSWSKPGWRLRALDTTTFGTAEQVAADRMFLARHNFAVKVSQLALEEYEARKKEIRAWFEKRVTANYRNLLGYVAADHGYHVRRHANSFADARKPVRPYLFSELIDLKFERDNEYHYHFRERWSVGAHIVAGDWNRGNPKCIETDAVASYELVLSAKTPADIALLAGCTVEELPDILQVWTTDDEYIANHILDRVDPMSWAARNPWRRERFGARIFLSKRALNSIKKTAKLPEGVLLTGSMEGF